MSAEWVKMKLGDFVELKRGYDLPKRNRKEGIVPVVSSSGESGTHDTAKVMAPGVVTGRYGTIGEVFFVEKDFWPLNTTLYVRDFKGNNPLFVYYFLKTLNYLDYSDKAAVPGINRNHLHTAEIRVPNDVNEQMRIALTLWDLDKKIELNRRISQTLEQIALAIFKSWFVEFEPVKAKIYAKQNGQDSKRAAMCAISGKTGQELDALSAEQVNKLATTATQFTGELEETEIGPLPKGWEWKALYDTAEYVNGAAFKSNDFSSKKKGLPIIKISELKQGVNSQTKFTEKVLKQKYLIDSGDVLYSWSGSPETSLEVFKWLGGKGWLNQHIFKLNFYSPEERYFAYYLLKHMKPFLVHTAKNKQTTGLGHVTVADMKRIKVAFPSHDVLQSFADFIGPIYEQDSQLQIQSHTLSQLRDAILPRLLSGKLPLDKTE